LDGSGGQASHLGRGQGGDLGGGQGASWVELSASSSTAVRACSWAVVRTWICEIEIAAISPVFEVGELAGGQPWTTAPPNAPNWVVFRAARSWSERAATWSPFQPVELGRAQAGDFAGGQGDQLSRAQDGQLGGVEGDQAGQAGAVARPARPWIWVVESEAVWVVSGRRWRPSPVRPPGSS